MFLIISNAPCIELPLILSYEVSKPQSSFEYKFSNFLPDVFYLVIHLSARTVVLFSISVTNISFSF